MELRDFIKSSITEIVEGLTDASKSLGSKDITLHTGSDGKKGVTPVQFDVAIVLKDESGGKAGGRIEVASIGIGGQKTSSRSSESISKVSFTVLLQSTKDQKQLSFI